MATQVVTVAFQVCLDPPENMLASGGGPIIGMDQHANNSAHVVTPLHKDDDETVSGTQ